MVEELHKLLSGMILTVYNWEGEAINWVILFSYSSRSLISKTTDEPATTFLYLKKAYEVCGEG